MQALVDKAQLVELRQKTRGNLSCGLLLRLVLPLTAYEVPLSKAEKRFLYMGKGILELPISHLTEEFKCAKVRLEMPLTQSKDPVVKSVAPTVKSGRMGHVQHGRGASGLVTGKPMWSKASVVEKRKMVVEDIHRQEEIVRYTKAVSQAKLWSMEASRIKFVIGAMYDVHQNLNQLMGEDAAWPLCSGICSLRRILSGCKDWSLPGAVHVEPQPSTKTLGSRN